MRYVSNLNAYPEDEKPNPSTSTMSDHDRNAELLSGLAARVHRLRQADEITEERRLSWQDLYDLFIAHPRVSKMQASSWADRIMAKGVERP